MIRFVIYFIALFIIIHGLIHLMGFVAYWPFAEISEIPYKTTILGGRIDLGSSGMSVYSLLWLVTAVFFIAAVAGLVLRQDWWWPLLWAAVLLSLVVCLLDWQVAFRGALLSLALLVSLGILLGLRIQPAPLAAYPAQTPPLTLIPVPDDLPAPVARYYETIAGEEVPRIETAVLTGRGTLRFNGLTFPARFRLVHDVGRDYRQYFAASYYGYPLLKADEYYIDGRATMNTPVGVIENDPHTDSAANLALWGISMMIPSVYVSDARVRWEAIDAQTARLVVPFGDEEDSFTVTFDPQTGLIAHMDAQRYYNSASEKKTWRLQGFNWQEVEGVLRPTTWTVTWLDEGSPWLVGNIEDQTFNVDVSGYLEKGEEGLAIQPAQPALAH